MIISPGDFFGVSDKVLKMLYRCRDFGFEAHFCENLKKKKEVEKKLKNAQKIFSKERKKEEKQNFNNARRILEYLNSFGVPVLVVPGNWEAPPPFSNTGKDYTQSMKKYARLKKGLRNIKEMHLRDFDFGGYTFVGLGICQMPENRYYNDPKLAEIELKGKYHFRLYNHWMRKMIPLFKRANKRKRKVIFISHNQPYDTVLDKIKDKNSPVCGEHYGSCVTRRLIDLFQPLVCVGAHMHENRGTCNVKKTKCINAGFAGHGEHAVFEVSGKSLKKVVLKKNK